MKEKIINYIEILEAKAYQSDYYFKQRNELYISNQEKGKEIEKLNNIINESVEEILKELEENHHLSYEVALAITQKLLDYKELKGDE